MSDTINPHTSAFPISLNMGDSFLKGLTKREYLMAQAITGLMSNPKKLQCEIEHDIDNAIYYVDLILHKLEQ